MTPITKKIGILGTGQLGRMLAIAGLKLGQKFLFCSATQDTTAKMGNFRECDDLKDLAQFADIITYESENVPVDWLKEASVSSKITPSIQALSHCSHRGKEKDLFRLLEIPTPAYRVVNSAQSLINAIESLGLPCVLKTTKGGYDGKGQVVLRNDDANELADAWYSLDTDEAIVEVLITFEKEVSIIGARDGQGNTKFYPVVTNIHYEGILYLTFASSLMNLEYQKQAESYLLSIMENLNYIGVMALELFVTKSKKIIANEIAPRVHNSGHWTLDGAVTSQFENHIRSIASIELGDTSMTCPNAIMVNLIGKYGDLKQVLQISDIKCHLYDKEERAKRKVGHLTLAFAKVADLKRNWQALSSFLPKPVKDEFEKKYIELLTVAESESSAN